MKSRRNRKVWKFAVSLLKMYAETYLLFCLIGWIAPSGLHETICLVILSTMFLSFLSTHLTSRLTDLYIKRNRSFPYTERPLRVRSISSLIIK